MRQNLNYLLYGFLFTIPNINSQAKNTYYLQGFDDQDFIRKFMDTPKGENILYYIKNLLRDKGVDFKKKFTFITEMKETKDFQKKSFVETLQSYSLEFLEELGNVILDETVNAKYQEPIAVEFCKFATGLIIKKFLYTYKQPKKSIETLEGRCGEIIILEGFLRIYEALYTTRKIAREFKKLKNSKKDIYFSLMNNILKWAHKECSYYQTHIINSINKYANTDLLPLKEHENRLKGFQEKIENLQQILAEQPTPTSSSLPYKKIKNEQQPLSFHI